jgi:hypothetical protein
MMIFFIMFIFVIFVILEYEFMIFSCRVYTAYKYHQFSSKIMTLSISPF